MHTVSNEDLHWEKACIITLNAKYIFALVFFSLSCFFSVFVHTLALNDLVISHWRAPHTFPLQAEVNGKGEFPDI